MIGYIVVAVVCILLGGFGGYKWGASVERKAAAVGGVVAGGLGSVAKKL